MIRAIAESAPIKFRDRALLLVESNASWVFASSATHIWYAYLVLRFGWRIPKQEIQQWHCSIKSIYGSDYRVYRLSTILANAWFTGLIALIFIAFQD